MMRARPAMAHIAHRFFRAPLTPLNSFESGLSLAGTFTA
jgi:hypothetical protein